LTDARRRVFYAHLQECERCRQQESRLDRVRAALARCQSPAPPADLWESLTVRARSRADSTGPVTRGRHWAGVVGLAALAVLLLAVYLRSLTPRSKFDLQVRRPAAVVAVRPEVTVVPAVSIPAAAPAHVAQAPSPVRTAGGGCATRIRPAVARKARPASRSAVLAPSSPPVAAKPYAVVMAVDLATGAVTAEVQWNNSRESLLHERL
jgi:hypothetical protein